MQSLIKVAFAGNPNVGKTTIINRLAGLNLKVGNWPGTTVEKKEATVKFSGYTIKIVDLPGIYTLEPLSEDERIAVDFLKKEKPDVIVNIVEATNLERSLNLTTELLEFEIPTVIVLNMIDEAEKMGIEIDTEKIAELLNINIVKTIGNKGKGVHNILPAIIDVISKDKKPKVTYSDELQRVIDKIKLEENKTTREAIELIISSERYREIREKFEKLYGKNMEDIIKDERYAFANGLFHEVFKRKGEHARDITDTIDKIILHPFMGILSLVVIVFLMFKIAFDFSTPFVDWVDFAINEFIGALVINILLSINAPHWLIDFFSEAVIGGVGFVLTFVPLIGVIYFLLTYLEMSGYLPRIAFLADRIMHKLGLHGKHVIPIMLAFGCNVPAIVATRTATSLKEKLIVISMIPFMSCPARLVVFSFFAVLFFDKPALVIASLYLTGILIGIITALMLRKFFFKEAITHFVMELPPYRFPPISSVLTIVWIHVKDFLYRAGTLIFGTSILIWLLINIPPGKDISESVASKIGRALVPIFSPIGIDDWKATTSLIPAFLAREVVIGSMGTIYSGEEEKKYEKEDLSHKGIELIKGFGNALKDGIMGVFSPSLSITEVEDEEDDSLKNVIRKSFTPLSAFSFMIFILIYTSCLGTVATMSREIGIKYSLIFLAYSFVVAWSVAFLIYQGGKLIG